MADGFELAQVNVAVFRKPQVDPSNADFVNALDDVNAAAEQSPGFIWRMQDETGSAINYRPSGNPNKIVNLSVWRDVASLRDFAYRQTDHIAIMKRRDEWFVPGESGIALWWVETGYRPDPAEALARLRYLQKKGPSPKAFTFKEQFEPA